MKFINYYLACRNKGGVLHNLGETSRWRAFKFACEMSWWGIRDAGFWDKALAVLLIATLLLVAARCFWWAGLCFVCAVFIPEPRS